jgi:hypothetical protein
MHKNTTSAGPFRARVHPANEIVVASPGYTLTTADIPHYDPINYTIVSCDQLDWDLAVKIMRSGRLCRLREKAEFFQGEVNETNARRDGVLTTDSRHGKLVTRGASICLYVTRPASQGHDLLLDVDRFLNGKDEDSKAFHFRWPRVCWQESSPQNNFRRVIAALVPAGQFCNHKVNYVPQHKSELPLEFILGLLNSKIADWYFRLGSTNAAVSHYQIYNLPCPVFSDDQAEQHQIEEIGELVRAGRTLELMAQLQAQAAKPPFGRIIQHAIIEAVERIIEIEQDRGEIRRVDRSSLDPNAQPFQDFIDRLFYAMAGLAEDESRGLEERLAAMQ